MADTEYGKSRQFLVFVTFCIVSVFVVHMSGIPPVFIIILCSVSFFPLLGWVQHDLSPTSADVRTRRASCE